MNRRTSHYRLIVAVPDVEQDPAVREKAIADLAAGLPLGLHLAGSGFRTGQVEISFRASDDLNAVSLAQGALRNGSFTEHEAWITTGYGVHKRRVAEQVAR